MNGDPYIPHNISDLNIYRASQTSHIPVDITSSSTRPSSNSSPSGKHQPGGSSSQQTRHWQTGPSTWQC